MANEFSLSSGLSVTKGSVKRAPLVAGIKKIDWNGTRYSGGSQDIGVTAEAIVLGADVASAGLAVFTNLDETNYVEVGNTNVAPFFMKLKPGEAFAVRLSSLTMFAKANSAIVKLGFEVYED